MSRWTIESSTRTVFVAQVLAFLLPLTVYVYTLSREVFFVDSGELAAAAATLGIAHPPGYPLFCLIGYLFSLLPAGAPIFRVGLISAAAGALATGLMFRVAWMLVGEHSAPGWPRRSAALGILSGTLLFAFAQTPWSQAVIVEVYALHGALIMALFFACAMAIRAGAESQVGGLRRQQSWGLLAGLLFGLSLTNHLTAALMLPAIAVLMVIVFLHRRRGGLSPWGAWGRIILAVPIPLLLYLYLPLRSRMDPPINWDYPETWHRVLTHVTARQYQGQLGSAGVKLEELHRFIVDQLPAEATLMLPILAALGIVVLLRERPWVLWLTVPVLLAQLLYNMAYPIHDIQVYYLPVVLILGLWAAAALGWIGCQTGHLRLPAAVILCVILALPPLLPILGNHQNNNRRDYRLTKSFCGDVIRYAESGAVIYSGTWGRFSGPMVYLQELEALRPDIVVMDMGRLASPMLGRDLQKRFPELAAACRVELEGMAEVATQAERGEAYDVAQGRRLYQNLLRKLVRGSMRLRPTYALGSAFQHGMFGGLLQHPEGLLVRLTTDPAYRPFAVPGFELPEILADYPPDSDARSLLGEYLSMLDGRIRYLQHHGRTAQADSVRAYLGQMRR